MKALFYLCCWSLLLASCSSNETCTDCELDQSNNDSLVEVEDGTLEQALKNEALVPDEVADKQNHEKIVQKYGVQWDFCTCVVANDSINKAFGNKLTDQQADKLMVRWEYVENKCKEFLTQPNTTPEERAKHEKKVKRCLSKK